MYPTDSEIHTYCNEWNGGLGTCCKCDDYRENYTCTACGYCGFIYNGPSGRVDYFGDVGKFEIGELYGPEPGTWPHMGQFLETSLRASADAGANIGYHDDAFYDDLDTTLFNSEFVAEAKAYNAARREMILNGGSSEPIEWDTPGMKQLNAKEYEKHVGTMPSALQTQGPNNQGPLRHEYKKQNNGKRGSLITKCKAVGKCFTSHCGKGIGFGDSAWAKTFQDASGQEMREGQVDLNETQIMMIANKVVQWLVGCISCLTEAVDGSRVYKEQYTKTRNKKAKNQHKYTKYVKRGGSKMKQLTALPVFNALNRTFKGTSRVASDLKGTKGISFLSFMCVINIVTALISFILGNYDRVCSHRLSA